MSSHLTPSRYSQLQTLTMSSTCYVDFRSACTVTLNVVNQCDLKVRIISLSCQVRITVDCIVCTRCWYIRLVMSEVIWCMTQNFGWDTSGGKAPICVRKFSFKQRLCSQAVGGTLKFPTHMNVLGFIWPRCSRAENCSLGLVIYEDRLYGQHRQIFMFDQSVSQGFLRMHVTYFSFVLRSLIAAFCRCEWAATGLHSAG